ncbi:MAG: thymidine kinase [Candidatus Woesebacteria bacterium]
MIGKLMIVTGPMFAGKTTALLSAASRYPADRIRIFKPKIDVRYSKQAVVSHTGEQIPAILIDQDCPDLLSSLAGNTQAIFIDELNFFDFDSLSPQIEAVRAKNIEVFGYGLSYDFAKNPFGATLSLIAKADSVLSLQAICDGCGKPAKHSYRKKKMDEYLVIGGAELYGACCQACWRELAQGRVK